MKPVVCIPARMNSSRLPGKILKDIGGKPMIRHVAESALEGGILPVYVAADHPDILQAIAGLDHVFGRLVPENYPSGSDRIQALLNQIDPEKKFDTIVNLQADMPFIAPDMIKESLKTLEDQREIDLGTIVAPLSLQEASAVSKVKVACAFHAQDKNARAVYFSRHIIPYGAERLWEHVGIYVWRRSSLERFVHAPPGLLEKQESLEQLRALELGMRVMCRKIEKAPISVDVPEELEQIRRVFQEEIRDKGR